MDDRVRVVFRSEGPEGVDVQQVWRGDLIGGAVLPESAPDAVLALPRRGRGGLGAPFKAYPHPPFVNDSTSKKWGQRS